MMIRHGKPEDSEKIMLFLNSVFKESSLVVYCSNLKEKLEKGNYKSIVAESEGNIVAHMGISLVGSVAIFNTLAVNPKYRACGLAKKLLAENINYCLNHKSITHAVGYCVLQHPLSERIHSDDFKPVGLMPVPEHPLKCEDPLHRQNLFSGNLVLCKTFQNIGTVTVNYRGPLEQKLSRICSKIGINLNFIDSGENTCFDEPREYLEVELNNPDAGKYLRFVENNNYAFLGLLPNVQIGLLNFGFMLKNKKFSGLDFVVNTENRKNFVRNILLDLAGKNE